MDEMVIVFSLFLMLSLAALIFIPALLTERAAHKVIGRFCRYKALGPGKAKRVEQLGLNPPGLIDRLTRPRDYKPYALRFLKEAGAVSATNDGRLYLNEQKLVEGWRCKRT